MGFQPGSNRILQVLVVGNPQPTGLIRSTKSPYLAHDTCDLGMPWPKHQHAIQP